jgi:zinc transport system substrate-binding protein
LIEAKEDESHGDEEHAHGDEEHSDKDAHGDEEHAHGEHDPHVWTDPANMALMARQVAQTLTTIDPDHASEYSANADAFAVEMERLGADFDAAFADCAADTVVTSHEAFAYLFARLGLASVTVAGINPDDQPSAKELAAIADIARDSGVTTISLDATASERLGQTIADEIGAEVAILDPVETVYFDATGGVPTRASISSPVMNSHWSPPNQLT